MNFEGLFDPREFEVGNSIWTLSNGGSVAMKITKKNASSVRAKEIKVEASGKVTYGEERLLTTQRDFAVRISLDEIFELFTAAKRKA
jgi:hypothetical protein